MANPASVSYREVTDANGRTFRVGEEPAQIMGRPRSYMVWLPWVAMMAAGIVEYAYGSAAKTLQASYHWSDMETFTLTGGLGILPGRDRAAAGRLRERNVFSARAAMLTGAVLCFLAFLTIGSTGNIVLASTFCLNSPRPAISRCMSR